jgi:hypothetical protein
VVLLFCRTGLQLIIQDGHVVKCYDSPWQAVYHSELGASAAVLAAGYNIDTLMLRWVLRPWQ